MKASLLPLACAAILAGGGTVPGWTAEPADPAPTFTPSEPLGAVIEARPGAAEVVDLEACARAALEANDRLRAERLRREELRGQMKQALSTGLPTIDLVGDWSRGRDPSFALDETFGGSGGALGPPPGSPDWFQDWLSGFGSFIPAPDAIPAQTFWGADLTLNWTINPSQILGATGAARLGIDRQEYSVRAVENVTVEATAAAYHDIVRAAERIRAVEAQVANQRELLDIVTMRRELGLATRLDSLQAAVTLANLGPQLDLARAQLHNRGARLNALMGRAPETPLSIANRQVVERDVLRDAAALELAQARPDVRAQALMVDIFRRNKQAQSADLRPYLTVFGSYGYVGRTVDTIFDDGHDSWRASVALNIPVFDGMFTRGRIAETKGRIRRAEAEVSGLRREVQVEVMEHLANLRMTRQVLDAATLNLERAEEVLEESLLMLQLGKVGYLDVLVSEANRAEARSTVIDARYQVLVTTASLKRALGFSPLAALADIPGLVPEVSP